MNVCLWHVFNIPHKNTTASLRNEIWWKWARCNYNVAFFLFIQWHLHKSLPTSSTHSDLCVSIPACFESYNKKWKITPACSATCTCHSFYFVQLLFMVVKRWGRGWWMNVDVIKQFSVCLKVCNFQPLPPHRHHYTEASKLLPFTRHENKNYFPIFLSCHPPFFLCKRQLPRMENKEEKSCCFFTSSKDCILFFVSVVFGTIFFIYACLYFLFPLTHRFQNLFFVYLKPPAFILHNSPSSIPHSSKKK